MEDNKDELKEQHGPEKNNDKPINGTEKDQSIVPPYIEEKLPKDANTGNKNDENTQGIP
jgi:hypothetical protein